jgi:hypothetical protein
MHRARGQSHTRETTILLQGVARRLLPRPPSRPYPRADRAERGCAFGTVSRRAPVFERRAPFLATASHWHANRQSFHRVPTRAQCFVPFVPGRLEFGGNLSGLGHLLLQNRREGALQTQRTHGMPRGIVETKILGQEHNLFQKGLHRRSIVYNRRWIINGRKHPQAQLRRRRRCWFHVIRCCGYSIECSVVVIQRIDVFVQVKLDTLECFRGRVSGLLLLLLRWWW